MFLSRRSRSVVLVQDSRVSAMVLKTIAEVYHIGCEECPRCSHYLRSSTVSIDICVGFNMSLPSWRTQREQISFIRRLTKHMKPSTATHGWQSFEPSGKSCWPRANLWQRVPVVIVLVLDK
jgi:hypothetical protein